MIQVLYTAAKLRNIYDTMDINRTGWFTSNNTELYSRCVFSNGCGKRSSLADRFLWVFLGSPRNTSFFASIGPRLKPSSLSSIIYHTMTNSMQYEIQYLMLSHIRNNIVTSIVVKILIEQFKVRVWPFVQLW